MLSKESIAVILGAIALGIRSKGSKDTQPVIENITEKELISRFGRFGHNLEKNQYLHASTGFENTTSPILKRNPNHPAVLSDEQRITTPDMGIYLTKDPIYALRYNEGKENRYMSLVEVNKNNLMIDEDVLGLLAKCVYRWYLENNEFVIEDMKNPRSISSILIKLYKEAMMRYGNQKPSDHSSSLYDFNDQIEEEANKWLESNQNEGFISMPHHGDEDSDVRMRMSIFLGKRLNMIISKEETKIISDGIESNNIVSDFIGNQMITMSLSNYLLSAYFLPDRENKGIKPIKVFRIID